MRRFVRLGSAVSAMLLLEEVLTPGSEGCGSRAPAVDRGNTIYVIPASELVNWEKASAQIDDDWVKEMNGKGLDGNALVKSAKDLIQKNTK